MSIDMTQQALNALAAAGLGNDSPAEAYVIGYAQGHDDALALAIRIEQTITATPLTPDEIERHAIKIAPAAVIAFAALAVGYGLGEQAQLGERDVQTVTQEVRRTGDVKRLCLTVKTGGRIDAITCQVLDGMTGELK